jgi:hypothetical protein
LLRLVAGHFRHEDVEQNDVEWFGSKRLQRLAAVRDGGDQVALPLDVAGPKHAVERLVVDDEDGCLSRD